MYGKRVHSEVISLADCFSVYDDEDVIEVYSSMFRCSDDLREDTLVALLSMDAKLLLADEPTGNLDTENSRRIIDLLLKLAHDDGCCVIVVTHDPDIAARADKVFRMRDGKLEEQTA